MNPDWPVDAKVSLEDLAQDFLQLLKDLGKTDIAIVGHSLGGLIALQMMILDPRRIARAVFLDPVGAKGVVFDESMYEAIRQMALSFELTQTVILSTIANAQNLPNALSQRIAKDAFKAVKGIGSSVLEILKTVDLTVPASRVRTPTLILHGQNDLIIPVSDSKQLSELMFNATFEILPQAGHCWNVENPADFVDRLRKWF
jgi:pimeloyl-ACP methyl ester carboxylesterase